MGSGASLGVSSYVVELFLFRRHPERPARFWIRPGDTPMWAARPRTVQPPSSRAIRIVESWPQGTERPEAAAVGGPNVCEGSGCL